MFNPNNYTEIVEKLQSQKKWFLILGVLLVIGGLIAAENLILATLFTIGLLGGFLIATGIFQLIQSFYIKQTALFVLSIAWSVIYLVAGLYIVTAPLQTSYILSMFLGIALVLFGISRLISGIMLRNMVGSGWISLTAILNFIFGIYILSHLQASSFTLFGILLSIDLIVQGLCFIMIYFAIKKNTQKI